MAKINHNNYLDTINDLITDATARGILHLTTQQEDFTGKSFVFESKLLQNFGTCGYMGLESDQRLKDRAKEFIDKFGTQFSVSRTYLTFGPNKDLEDMLSQMYGGLPAIVYSSTSTAHISIVPSVVRDTHAIILDQQVHMSVQTAAQITRQRGVPIEMIRHSNLEMLERKLQEWNGKYQKVWYMIDGVYSMFGDVAPLDGLKVLMEKYPELNIYVDDAHGMSWHGVNGTGLAFDMIGGVLPERIILITTIAKGFGAVGGVGIFPNQETYKHVKTFGGPLTYSHPLAPPVIGAAIASAEIHLSPEIYEMQAELKQRIDLCNSILDDSDLPLVCDKLTPIYFVGMGQPKVGFNMVRRLFDEGYYVNLGMFPAVPVKCTGLRFCINRHNTLEDIKGLAQAINYHFPKALEIESRTENDVRKAFHLPLKRYEDIVPVSENQVIPLPNTNQSITQSKDNYIIQHTNNAVNLNEDEWNGMLGENGTYSIKGLMFLEDAFSNNELAEDNWIFHYYIIRNKIGEPILATFFTECIFKDDFLSPASVSMQIEEKRQSDPYYLTSHTLGMGSLITEGKHLFIDRKYENWKKALQLLMEEVAKLQDKEGIQNVVYRDFETDDEEIRDIMADEGCFRILMPNANVLQNFNYTNHVDEYLNTLSSKNRAHIRSGSIKFESYYDLVIKDSLTQEEKEHFRSLYMQIKDRNFAINYFPYPEKVFDVVDKYDNWEFVILKLKPEYDARPGQPAVSIGACYKGAKHYVPLLLGMDYGFSKEFNLYRQSLWGV
ncbi:MAG: aminotransferase class I/II-fold pyridoxal phosphate-dependent enzyme, partial [Bacteroidota bacterium]|nr:aminotransferase class I/II-fold pyridoxal phosphate-dependent enzyme [Bacteroidota bacterium]